MLRIVQNSRPNDAKSYFRVSDYYTADRAQEMIGRWGGRAAEMLGLHGQVTQPEFEALCDHINPLTGESLTQRTKDGRTAGYDFNFNAPKSLSLLYGIYRDPALLDAFRSAVQETMEDVERDMMVRVRKDGRQEDRPSGNMVWAEFVHFTARPVGGIPDASLHAHMFAFNASRDPVEGIWKAGQFRQLKRDAGYYEAAFHSRLAKKVSDLGFGIVRKGRFWDIAGVSNELITKFSRRMLQVNAQARSKGITDPGRKSELAATTREKKTTEFTSEELRDIWVSQMTQAERQSLSNVHVDRSRFASGDRAVAPEMAMQQALDHSLERESVITERELLAEALRRGVGSVSLQDVQSELAGHGILRHERDGERLVSTRAVLTEEQGLLQFAREGRASVEPLVTGHVFRREWLNDEQKSAVRAVLESTDRVTLIRGVAGTGKTTLTKEAVEAITRAGTPVVMVAPTSQSARGVLRDQEGFSEADTLQRLLVDSRMQARLDKAVLWIDEAGLVGCRDMARVFELARSHDARVVLMGDSKQHRAVARGGMMRLLEQQAGLRTIQVSDIRRQSGRYRSAVAAFASERTDEGLGIIEELGWLHEGTDGEQHQQLARDFADATGRGDDVLVVSPTHFEGRLVTDAIRDELRSRELLGADHAVPRLIPLHWTEADRASPASYRDAASPLVVQFEQNAKGFQRGDRAEVLEWGGEGVRVRLSSGVVKDLPLESPARFTVYRTDTTQIASGDRVRLTHNASINGRRLNNGAVYTVKSVTPDGAVTLDGGPTLPAGFGFLDHGWVVTSHSAQGRTHDRVFVAASSESLGAINRAQTYVSASRGRYQVAVYTDDKDALKKAAERADRSLTATELVAPVQRAKGKARRHVMFLQRMASRLSDYASRVVDTFRGHVREEEHSRRLGYGR